MNFLLSVTEENYSEKIINTLGLSETALFGLQMVLIGMLTVFSVLIIIWIALTLFKIFFYDMANKKPHTVKEAPVAVEAAPVVAAPSQDEEIIAVIAAAIAMAESEGCGVKFRVVSFRRK